MKKLIIITVISLFILPIQAQNLISDSAVWHYSMSQFGGGGSPPNAEFVKFKVAKDTLYKGKVAKKITREYYRYRGDTVLWKPLYLYDKNDTVYYYNGHYQRYIPLYDFTASVNDTLRFYIPDTNWIRKISDSTFRLVVDSVKFLTIKGDSLKAIYTRPLDLLTISGLSSDLPYVEKLGSMSILLPRTTATVEHDGPLRCYEDDSISVNFYGKACDYRIISSLNKLEFESSAFQIHPNPVNQTAKIELGNLKAVKIELIDISGSLIKTFPKNTKKLDFSAVNNGLYFVRITTANQGQFNKKIVVQK